MEAIKKNEMMSPTIQHIRTVEIPHILERVPNGAYCKYEFTREGTLWRFSFNCAFSRGQISALAVGRSATEAFAQARDQIMAQIQNWHKARFLISADSLPPPPLENKNPMILLIEDDEDQALAANKAFQRLGWQTDIVVRHEDLHRKIIDSKADFILLDWNLNDAMTAKYVFEKVIRLIDAFPDLRESFGRRKPGIVTYSVLDRKEIQLPFESKFYFKYLDHWKKPLSYNEVVARATEMMTSNVGS